MTRERDEAAQDRVVVGVDGSEESKAAVQWAADLAKAFDYALDVVCVWEFPVVSTWENNYAVTLPGYDPESIALETAEAVVRDVFGEHRPEELSIATKLGSPGYALIEASAEAKLLVVGSRGLGGFRGLLLGSVSQVCAEHAKCPVLVVH